MTVPIGHARRYWVTAGLLAIVVVIGVIQAANPHSYVSEVLSRAGESISGPDAAVIDLKDIGQLQAAFNHDVGDPRLILLFSPT